MFRRVIVAALAATIALVAVPGSDAQAQTREECQTTYNEAVGFQSCQIRYPANGFNADKVLGDRDSEPNDNPQPVATPTPRPAAVTTQADVEQPQLAFTGAESDVLAYVGTGMIAFGALALAARRRLDD